MKTAFFLRSLACAAILAVPAHAQLYSLHGDGVKKADRVVEKADYSGYELVWNDEFDKDGRPDPADDSGHLPVDGLPEWAACPGGACAVSAAGAVCGAQLRAYAP